MTLHVSNSATGADEPARVCAYYRVSTGRQAEGDLSIPDQQRQIVAFCRARGWRLVAEYVEPGASATDDNRPEFQKMIERATDDDRPFDTLLVHSYSRFFRDAFGLEMYVRKLAKANVRLLSITQELGDDPVQTMMRSIIALFDEYQSRENAKHVLRAMKENGRQGFYNGAPVPLGYKTVEVEKRGARVKKRLAIDTVEAETVRLIFRLYAHGDGKSGPLGVKEIAKRLNKEGYRTRRGARFGVGPLHALMTNRVYVGEWIFNRRNAKTKALKPASEHVTIEVPPIIERGLFDAVQSRLKLHNPRVTPARIVTGPVLLTGLTVCASCGAAMTTRTGTSKTGRVYRYYACSACSRMGKSACNGHSIAMDKLDDLVVDHLSRRLLTSERLSEILSSLAARRAEHAAEVDGRIRSLQRTVNDAEEKLTRLYRLVEDGVAEMDDMLRERIAALRADRERARAALDRVRTQAPSSDEIPVDVVERFARIMRENIASGEVPFRKAYIRSVVSRIEIDDKTIRIIGRKAQLEHAITGKAVGGAGVRSSVLEWRALRESNPPLQRERLPS